MRKAKIPQPVEREYLGVDEAEFLSGRSRWTWRRDCYEGRVASVKIGRRLLIPLTEIRRVIAEGLRPAMETKGRARDSTAAPAA